MDVDQLGVDVGVGRVGGDPEMGFDRADDLEPSVAVPRARAAAHDEDADGRLVVAWQALEVAVEEAAAVFGPVAGPAVDRGRRAELYLAERGLGAVAVGPGAEDQPGPP